MALSTTLPITAALAIAGTIAGVQLGRSAIAEIDPAHFAASDGERFFADLVPGGQTASSTEEGRANDFWANEASIPASSGCYRCGQFIEPAEFSAEADYPSMDIGTFAQSAALPPPIFDDRRDSLSEDIARYATFPVTREEAERGSEPAPGQVGRLSPAGPLASYSAEDWTEEAVPIGM